MALYDSIDLNWSWDGDYGIDEMGDIQDTSTNLLTSLSNEIQTVIKSEPFDWERDITLGATLSDFHGQPNTREVAKALEQRIKSSLSNHGIVQLGDISVRVVPVHVNQTLVAIRVAAQATPRNGLVPGEPLKVDLIYDSLENSTFFLLANQVARRNR